MLNQLSVNVEYDTLWPSFFRVSVTWPLKYQVKGVQVDYGLGTNPNTRGMVHEGTYIYITMPHLGILKLSPVPQRYSLNKPYLLDDFETDLILPRS